MISIPSWAAPLKPGRLDNLQYQTQVAQHAKNSPFNVRALYLVLTSKDLAIAPYTVKQASLRGYNTAIFAPGSRYLSGGEGKAVFSSPSWSDAKMKQLIRDSYSSGMEPIIGIKCIGKQQRNMHNLVKKYPDLLITRHGSSVLNPKFRFPDSKDAFHGALLPLIENALSWYGDKKPKYFLLGVDEISIDALAAAGKKCHPQKTAAQVFAFRINRLTEYLLKKGITPIIWGDMLL